MAQVVTVKGGDMVNQTLSLYASKRFKSKGVQVGFLNGATEADGTLVALVAALNEYGTRNMPPRPFFRNAIAKNDKKWGAHFVKGMKNTNGDVDRVFDALGTEMADDIKASIIKLRSPKLAASTIARKGFDKPLIDTHTMLDNVTYKVNR